MKSDDDKEISSDSHKILPLGCLNVEHHFVFWPNLVSEQHNFLGFHEVGHQLKNSATIPGEIRNSCFENPGG